MFVLSNPESLKHFYQNAHKSIILYKGKQSVHHMQMSNKNSKTHLMCNKCFLSVKH